MLVTYMEKQKLEKLKLIYDDKYGIAQTMRQNLASDITCGYGLGNVVRQMVAIEDYENNVVANAKKEYEDYKGKLDMKRYKASVLGLVWEDYDPDE